MNAAQLQTIIEEARSREDQLPVSRRVLLYRGLAELCGEPHEAARFNMLANELEQADLRCRQFQFATTPSADQTAKMAV